MTEKDGSLVIQDGQTVVFIGDSITDCGRRDVAAPLGNGYASMVVGLIAAKYPQRKIRFVNTGIGGDVATGLRGRWDEDVIAHKPDWVSVLVGINDLHRTLREDPAAVPPAEYRRACTDFLESTAQRTDAGLILMDPFYMARRPDPGSPEEAVLNLLPEYVAIVTELAGRLGARHVRLHEAFQRVLEHYGAEFLCAEPVHPNPAGHLVIAHEWLRAMAW